MPCTKYKKERCVMHSNNGCTAARTGFFLVLDIGGSIILRRGPQNFLDVLDMGESVY